MSNPAKASTSNANAMNVLLIEPYFGGSHRTWALGYQRASRHHVQILSLPAQFWKWRMQGGAVTLARLLEQHTPKPDVILASDMMNLATFRALTRHHTANVPIALYFHENQLSYPQNKRQGHGWRYGFINYISALAADAVYFNSRYHLTDFFDTLPDMLKHFGDYNELDSINTLRQRAGVLPVGIDFARLDAHRVPHEPDAPPIVLWNHRWESDKNPQAFVNALITLADEGIPFRLVLLGEQFGKPHPEWIRAQDRLAAHIIHTGYADAATYAAWLWRSDVVVSTAKHEFFGISTAEAIYCGCLPILPKRLNYPALVPDDWHTTCLYKGNNPYVLLKQHLTHPRQNTAPLQSYIAQFDWSQVAPHYDTTLSTLQRYMAG